VVVVILAVLIIILTKNKPSEFQFKKKVSSQRRSGLCSVVNIICPPLRWNSTGIMAIKNNVAIGDKSNEFTGPWDMVLYMSNTLYITDWGNSRVQKYFIGETNGTTVAGQENGTQGSNSTDLRYVKGIAINNDETIYVADEGNHRIQRWYKNASYGDTIAGITGICVSSNKTLCNPQGLFLDETSNTLYIADMSNHRIMSYQPGRPCCSLVAGGNGNGLATNYLSSPFAVYFDSLSNSLLIANQGANNIVRWTLGATNWNLVAGSTDGTNGTTIAGSTSPFGSNPTSLSGPRSFILDNQLHLYVVDHWSNRILKFLRY